MKELEIEDSSMNNTKVRPDEAPSPTSEAEAAADAAKKAEELPKCSYWKLFSNADRFDKLLMAIGIVGSLCNGRVCLCAPVSELSCLWVPACQPASHAAIDSWLHCLLP